MPYIHAERREFLETEPPSDAGELNYVISMICRNYYMAKGHSYQTHNTIIGVLECTKQEWYRRCTAPYEDYKINENGDVYV